MPEGLAVVGMDDIEMSAYTDPPLTTVRVAKDAMGRLAADWLIGLIEGARDGSARPAGARGARGPRDVRGPAGIALLAAAIPAEARSTISTTEGA